MEAARGKYERAVCLGDLVGYGPDPNAVIDPVRELAEATIRGNHDKACCGISDAEDFNPLARAATLWTRQQLTSDHLTFLRELPQGPAYVNSFEIVHGAPADEDEYIVGPDSALPALKDLTTPVVFFGHTHLQGGVVLTAAGSFQQIFGDLFESSPGGTAMCTVKLETGARYLINPGSVGQPRDGDWRAAFAILDEAVGAVEYYRTPYDLEKTQEKMRRAGLPEPLIRRLEFGR